MLDLHSWLILTAVCLLGAMTPGASLAVVTRHTVLSGARGGVTAGLAHAGGIAVYAAASVAGLAALLHRFPWLETLISAAGALFLLWLAWKSGRAAAGPAPEAEAHTTHGAARDGFLIALLNPKVALFFLALFSQFIEADMGTPARLQMATTAVVIDGAWYSLFALVLARGPAPAWLARHHDWLERGTALILAGLALAVLARIVL
ncbi:amino acid transporter LysE [Alcanivorax xiamenensis]|uniref:Amino acid transporter LysE n=1 Tax=Alcanivorax xiamenensis TaxID=1177156 RepID=A0ABQ6Y508_9GAMM|nr:MULTISPECIES: LysE family translocator [Alcanivorax]KAF0804306.1 amino acid transporter LysE [Alcanivorax xiamenensis]